MSTDLQIPADDAYARARRLETFRRVVWPVLRFAIDDVDDFEVGDEFSARLWLFQVIPLWTHHLKIVEDGSLELYTNERSGPARVWNHRLTFVPTGEHSCRYTDEVEIERGPLGAGTALFIHVFFRYRQWRWRRLVDGRG
ncbi:MAG: hypothetical protein QM648_06180 [Solirubrobacterales bacterium]